MTSPNANEGAQWGALRVTALVALLLGAVGSIALMLRTSPNMPKLLVVLIGLWVISPFVLLAFADRVLRRRPVVLRTTTYLLSLVITAVSLWVYRGVAYGPPRPKPAFFFVLLPPISWLLVATGVAVAALVSRKRSTRPA